MMKRQKRPRPSHTWSGRSWAKRLTWMERWLSWFLCGAPAEDYCDCLDPWTCGRPHLKAKGGT